AANMAGNYPANKSFTIIGTLSDKFTSVEFSATVATESVVMSYDKDGRVGVGKIVENGPPGSVDIAGEYYAKGKQIQQHQLTSNAGRSPYNAPGTLDLNTKTINEFFACNEPVNGPVVGSDRSEFYVAVYSESDNYLSQNAIQKGTGRMFTRTRHGGTWTPWVEYATTNHPMLQEKPLKTLTMGFPYSMKANLVRKGDVVTISLIRNIYSVDSFEHAVMQEKIPAGYRPVVDVHMTVNTNVSQFTKSPNILHFAPDGTIRMTSNTVGGHVMTGTITYITNDPYPT
ncbi:TPA: hypothetical protein TY284_002033, partial [Streptococcus suis]|nr:hypothetical protein [Streptococcus suis]